MNTPDSSMDDSRTQSGVADNLVQRDARYVWHPFTHTASAEEPLVITSAQGAVLNTSDGREILDCISSWWVNLFGHGHPVIAEAIYEQARKLEHVIFAGFTHEPAIRLAESLAGLLPGDLNRVFFSDNGSTSVEVALKIAAQHWQNLGQRRQRVMVFDGGYHGDTVGAMSVGVSSGFFDSWKKWLVDVDVMPYPETWTDDPLVESKEDVALVAIDEFLDQHGHDVVAMIMEPLVQGASGMRMCRPGFLKAVVDRLQEREITVIFDEVMTGFGRTGRNFACEVAGVQPDIICLSKGLTGGFMPMGATVVSDRIYESFQFESPQAMFCHGHSYTANPLGCAAAGACLDLLQTTETTNNWKRLNAAHQLGLSRLAGLSPATRLRCQGTIAAVNIAVDDKGYHSRVAGKLKSWFREENELVDDVLIRPLGNAVYLLPPYCMTDQQLEIAWRAVGHAIEKLSETI